MKRQICIIMVLIALAMFFGVVFCNGEAKDILLNDGLQISVNMTDKQVGYQIASDGKNVVFIFDQSLCQLPLVKKVNVCGSFNSWSKTEWPLQKSDIQGIWFLKKPVQDVRVPGNCGVPEFKFYVDDGLWLPPVSTAPGSQFLGSGIILFSDDNKEEIIANATIADKVKKLSDFKLANDKDAYTIANFRLVPGTTKFFRSYHPYKKSHANFDTEDARIAMVKKLMERNRIHSVISLSGNEAPTGSEVISDYQQNIIKNNHEIFPNTSYNIVYFKSNGPEFAGLIQTIVEFIIDPNNEAPFLVHCRLGTDRTGTVSAVIAALCGASWQDIKDDYQKSNGLGIKEFRDYRLLQYSFENMLGIKINNSVDLKSLMSAYFVKGCWLTNNQLQTLMAKLK